MEHNSILPSAIEIPLDAKTLDEIKTKAIDFALMNGICMRSKINFNEDSLQVN
jgi:hypothetical protein